MTATATGTAERNGRQWGARARDWAEEEEREAPKYEAALARVGLSAGDAVLDIGCGSGVFLRMAADRGARVSGLDASEALLRIARERVPDADLRRGDMQRLPHEDGAFDLVTGFNSFFFADDMTAALREGGRVARPGAAVVIQVWGRPERCDLTPALAAIRALRPQAPPPPPAPLWQEGVLESIAAAAGLRPEAHFDVSFPLGYSGRDALLRTMLSPGPVAEAIEAHGEDAVAREVLDALAPRRRADGGYRLDNEWHTLIARA